MGRNCINRMVQTAPLIKGFKPFGGSSGKREVVVLSLDEYEAIRLLDYLHMNQEEAAGEMQVSRPTLTRIYEKARIKYATALVEGCELLIEGGEIVIKQHSFSCGDCHAHIQSPEMQINACPKCNSTRINSLDSCHRQSCNQCRKCRKGGKNAKS